MSDTSDNCEDEYTSTPNELQKQATEIYNNLLPVKSRERYEKQYRLFNNWKKSKKAKSTTENVVLAYLSERAKTVNSATLWSQFSMLKSTHKVKENIDFNQFHKVQAFLKQNSVDYKAKKSQILTQQECIQFLKEAPDSVYLMMKVSLIMGLYGACRRIEVLNLTLDQIEKKENILLITIPKTKNNIIRTFTITNKIIDGVDLIKIYEKYISLRPSHTPHNRLFIYYKNGKCTIQAVGKNTFSKIPSHIATLLNLPNPKLFTGHCFRRSSASLLANSGADLLSVKRHGGWRSSAVAEGYIDDCLQNKIEVAGRILEEKSYSTSGTAVDQPLQHIEHRQVNTVLSTDTSNRNPVQITTNASTSYEIPSNSRITINN